MDGNPRTTPRAVGKIIERQRWALLRRVEAVLELPMMVLALVWLGLLIVDLTRGLTRPLELLGLVIWGVFLIDFAIKLLLAPAKLAFLKTNWLTVLALLLPALRVFRIFRALRVLRAARAARGLRLARVLTSLNRGMRALGGTLQRRGFAYLGLLTIAVTLAGAAGMYAFEADAPGGGGLATYGRALWWTAMLMTTMGSEYWPRSAEGRLLCLLLSLYAFTVFGYVTASLATFFIGRDAHDRVGVAGAGDMANLAREIGQLRKELQQLRDQRSS